MWIPTNGSTSRSEEAPVRRAVKPGSARALRTVFIAWTSAKICLTCFTAFTRVVFKERSGGQNEKKLHYEEGNSEILLQKFYQLLIITRRRQGLPVQPLSWFRGLIAMFGEALKIRVASKDDLPVASILTLVHKQSMVYKYGSSDARFHRLGGVAFLFWKAIQEAKEKGYEEFELGRSDSDNLGLISFKERWGTVSTHLSYWAYPQRRAFSLSGRRMTILRRLVPLAPTFALRMAGRLFYGHAG
jgi:hypothetical protein